jgi:hypothetical protein
MLALYLLTNPHANLIGCYRLPDAYAADDLQWSCERVREGFIELSQKGFLTREDGANWVFIHKYLKWNEFENGNVAIAASKAFDQIPPIPLKALLAAALIEFGSHLKEAFSNHLRTLVKPFANPEPILNPTLTQPEPMFGSPPVGDEPPPEKKQRTRKPVADSAKTWDAYSKAYEGEYGCKPVRNARVNAQMSQVIAALGTDDSPGVAAFFVAHQNRFYKTAGHSVGCLLRDAEKLRTEWATGRNISSPTASSFKDSDDEKGIGRWEEQTGRVHPSRMKAGVVIDISSRELTA